MQVMRLITFDVEATRAEPVDRGGRV